MLCIQSCSESRNIGFPKEIIELESGHAWDRIARLHGGAEKTSTMLQGIRHAEQALHHALHEGTIPRIGIDVV
jgi:hypothetical protein